MVITVIKYLMMSGCKQTESVPGTVYCEVCGVQYTENCFKHGCCCCCFCCYLEVKKNNTLNSGKHKIPDAKLHFVL